MYCYSICRRGALVAAALMSSIVHAALPSDIDLRVASGDDRTSIDIQVDGLVEAGLNDSIQWRFIPDIGGDGIVEYVVLIRDPDNQRCDMVLVPSELTRERRLDPSMFNSLVRYDNLQAFFGGSSGRCFVSTDDIVPLGDINGDGVRDIGIGGAGALVLYGRVDAGARVDVAALTEAGGFHVSGTFFVGNNRDVGTVGDLDGDGFDEIGLGDRVGDNDVLRVLRGAPARQVNNALRTLPDEDLLIDLGITFQFPEVIDLGDTNGDGTDDLLIATFNRGPYLVEGSPVLRLRAPSLDAIVALRLVDECGERGRICRFGATGDFDGDGFTDLIGTFSGFPDERQPTLYDGPEGVILYGRAGGLPRVTDASELRGRGISELRNASVGPAASIDGFAGFFGGEDLNGDGLADVLSSSGLTLLGDATRPAEIQLDQLDGVNGLVFRGNGGRVFMGDLNGDSIDDLISDNRDGIPLAYFGRRDTGAPRSPVDVVVRYGPVTTDVLWFAPREDADITGYRVFVNGVPVAEAGRDERALTFSGPSADPDSAVEIASIGQDGSLSPLVRFRFDRFGTRIGNLQGQVYGPTSGELMWPQRLGSASVWRDEVYLTGTRGASLYLDDLEPGTTATYFITSPFVRPTDNGRSTVRSTGPVYPRSERVMLTTPGGNPSDTIAPVDPPDQPVSESNVPTQPGRLRATVYSPLALELLWEPSRDDGFVRGYEIVRNGEVLDTRDALSYFDDTLPNSGRYDYTVTALDFDGNRSPVASVSVDTDNPDFTLIPGVAPNVPTGLRVAVYSSTAFEVFWDRAQTPSLSYEITVGDRAAVTSDGTSLFVSDVSGRVDVALVAIAPDGTRSSAIGVTARTSAGSPDGGPAAPTGLRASRYSATAGEIFWDRADTSGLRYEIVQDGRVVALTTGISYFTTRLSAGELSRFEVLARRDSDGSESETTAVTMELAQ